MKPLLVGSLLVIICSVVVEGIVFGYGTHFPYGLAAVNYAYSGAGMWKNFTPAQYIWNYYDYPNLPSDHPYNISALIQYSTGPHVTTCLDANEHLLLDFNHDGEIDTTNGGFSFHEHNGRGQGDTELGAPFNNFWFDDNWLCRYMSEAYGLESPNGLSDYDDFTRWRIVGGSDPYWSPYPNDANFVDLLALNGLYYITQNDFDSATSKWKGILAITNPTWNSNNQEYDFTLDANYYLGLMLIFANYLRFMAPDAGTQEDILQYAVSIRSNILWNQVVNSSTGAYCSWCSNIPNGGSVMNAETTAACVLGLGAGYIQSFEVGVAPMQMASASYFMRPYHVLSAVVGLSSPNYMSYGPYVNYPVGSYTVEFVLRCPDATGTVAHLDVSDDAGQGILAATDIDSSQFTSNGWIPFDLAFTISDTSENSIEFRIYWYGTSNLDASIIRVS